MCFQTELGAGVLQAAGVLEMLRQGRSRMPSMAEPKEARLLPLLFADILLTVAAGHAVCGVDNTLCSGVWLAAWGSDAICIGGNASPKRRFVTALPDPARCCSWLRRVLLMSCSLSSRAFWILAAQISAGSSAYEAHSELS